MIVPSFSRIGDTCAVGDGTHSKISRQSTGVPYLTCRNFKDGRIDLSKVYFISEADYAKHFLGEGKALARPEKGDLVFSIIGTIGEPYLVRESDRWGISSSVAIVRPRRGVLDPGFLLYWFKGPMFQAALRGIKGGVAQGYVSLEMIRSLSVRMPPMSEQRRIASVLSTYDDLIENCERRIRVLDEMARALYREWFVLFRYPGHEKTPLVDSPLGRIPKGWQAQRAGAVARETRRGVPKGMLEGGPARYVGLGHIPRRSLALDTWQETTEVGSNKLRFERGEILFGKIRPYFHKVSIAPFSGVCSADTFVISPTDAPLRAFASCLVSSDEFVAHASATANGAKMPRANWGVMMDFPVAMPVRPVLAAFSAVVEPWLDDQMSLVFQAHNLRKTRDLLLPRLLSGELSVEDEA